MNRIFTINLVLFFALLLHKEVGAQCNGAPCPTPIPSVNAQDACILPSPSALSCYYGATTPDAPQSLPPSWCSSIENNHWFAFVADAPTVNFTIEVIDCSSGDCLQAAVLSTVDCNTFTFEGPCISGMNPGGIFNVPASNLVPGQVYYLTIDGCSGAICNYSINGSNPIIQNVNPLVCLPAGPVAYTSNMPGNWSINPPGAGNFIGPSVNVQQVVINWTQQGDAQVCVGSTVCPNENCRDIVVGRREATLIEVLQCPGEDVECSGNIYSFPGTYINNYETYQGCDSVVTCRIIPVPVYNSPLMQINKCAPDTYEVCGDIYDTGGGYQHACTGWLGCDSIINFILAIMEPQAIIAPPAILDCDSNQVVTLDGSASPPNAAAGIGGFSLYNWSGPGIVGPFNQPTVMVNQPGEYCLIVTHARGGVFCADTTCVTVLANTATPQMPLLAGNPNPCGDSTMIYTVTANGNPPPASFVWTTPANIAYASLSANSIQITWDTVLTGPLCVTANNACGASPPACMPIVVQQPVVSPQLNGPGAVCAAGGGYLFTLDTFQVGTNYTWTVPAGAVLTGSGDSVSIDFANASGGQVCVTAQNACGSIPPICQNVQVSPPASVVLSGGGQICQGESINLLFTTSGNGPFDVIWSDGTQNDTLTAINNGHTITLIPSVGTSYTLISANDGSNPACPAVVSGGAMAVVQPNYTVNASAQICEGDSILLGGFYQYTSGVYTDSLNSVFGCDSVIITTLTVLDVDTTQIVQGSCDPGQVGVFTQILSQANGCDSVVITTINLLPTHVINISGTSCDPALTGIFVQNLTNQFGCDSTVTLTVTYALSDTVLLFGSSCNPAEVGVFTETYVSSIGCDSAVITTISFTPLSATPVAATTCDPAAAGVFSQTFVTSEGCDSTVVTTVSLLPESQTSVAETSCNPADVGVFTEVLSNFYGCDSTITTTVTLLPGSTTTLSGQSCNPADVGVFVQTLTNYLGCDSIVTTTILFSPIPPTPLTATTCDPTAAGVFSQTLTTAAGCDSTIVTTVTLLPSSATALTGQSCNPANVGVFVQNLTNEFGCDSIVTTTVSFFQIPPTPLTATTCDPAAAGVFSQTLTTAAGCDSTIVTTVSLLPSNTTTLFEESCNPGDVGTFVQNLANQYGCDSIVTTTVSLLPSNEVNTQSTTCDPAGIGVFVYNLTNQFGCDSIVFETVSLLPSNTNNIALTTCDAGQVGTTTQVLTNQFGCDSTVITTTSLLPPANCGATAGATGSSISCEATTGTLTVTATLGIPPFNFDVLIGGNLVATGVINAVGTPETVVDLPAGTYTIVLTASTGFTATAQATIVQLFPPVISGIVASDFGGFGVSCDGGTDGSATATVTGGKPPYTYEWSEGSTAIQANNLSAGTYTLTVTDSDNCTASSSITLTQPEPLAIAFTVTGITCFGNRDGSISVQATGGIPPYRFALNTGGYQASNTFANLGPGSFTIRVEDAGGCETAETIVVNAPPPFQVDLGGTQIISLGDSTTLQVLVNVPIDSIQSVSWGPPLDTTDCTTCLSYVVAPFVTTTYSVTVVTTGGCSDADQVTVFVDRRRYLYVPNAFSPNGDGENDVFAIFAKPNTVKNIKTMQLFNRWGEAVFQLDNFLPNNPTVGWDGTFRGQPMNPAVFAWMLEVEFIDGVTEVYTGDVTIVR
ncbi:MAG: gliding motility-associated C-terminal domain-containing protein [Lewinellaceae bacterium]|nr:gliding motility-associated C-terminal domain-containing protein [Lewinellaceae bacterium]